MMRNQKSIVIIDIMYTLWINKEAETNASNFLDMQKSLNSITEIIQLI